jgi:hypothetical protein
MRHLRVILFAAAVFGTAVTMGLSPQRLVAQAGFYWGDAFVSVTPRNSGSDAGTELLFHYQYASYPSYSSYPTYPSYPSYSSYPTYPSYPSYSSYPTYPSYPSYSSYPRYPSYPSYSSYPIYPPRLFRPPQYQGFFFLGNTAAELQAGVVPAQYQLAERARRVCLFLTGWSPRLVNSTPIQFAPGSATTMLAIQDNGLAMGYSVSTSFPFAPTYLSVLECFQR